MTKASHQVTDLRLSGIDTEAATLEFTSPGGKTSGNKVDNLPITIFIKSVIHRNFYQGDNLDSEDPPASYIVKLTTGNSTKFEDFEVDFVQTKIYF